MDECVVVLHGLGRTANSMDEIEEKLLGAGYRVWNEGYPSRRENITSLAAIYVGSGARYCADASRMHFVTHSLGGILVRQYLQQVQLENLGRIVMLAPPNRGSKVTDRLRDSGWYRSLIGPAGQQLGTGQDSVPNALAPIPGEIGVIAGVGDSDPWFSWMFDGPNDGKVSVASTRLDEMKDFLVVDAGHTMIMRSDYVIAQILHFLRYGSFDRELEGRRMGRRPMPGPGGGGRVPRAPAPDMDRNTRFYEQ